MTARDWRPQDTADFLNTLGSQFADVLYNKAGILPSGADSYSAIVEVLGTKDITPDILRSLSPDQVAKIAAELNLAFETKRVKAAHVTEAIKNTLWHWS